MKNDNDIKRRGRPAKSGRDTSQTKAELISSGVEHFTQFGFASSGLEQILKKVSVPKGSFYYYFANKEVFGLAVISHYDGYFCRKLDTHLKNEQLLLQQRLMSFVDDAKAGIEKYHFNRGCLVGNLEQEIAVLPNSHRDKLVMVMQGWQRKIADHLNLLCPEVEQQECQLLAEFFWIGWEGAVSRCKLMQSTQPIDLFINHFLKLLVR
ncbi:acrylate utilization transcriptional regulator AcuR [Colwellia sp. 12G3]|uniref:acrylate utilization transcriptional regulator AcuR n=1 Tax=Colwellia sp. 12G3 TaxID=2058299 RepID=UPI000C32B3D0|nr:TetR family transcriptional regulator C-terminal domain-containing protein [Colwellia sp. 12G3]PKI17739.1 TetR family transcriptional regulator [Colwellia sp. 12G3]